MFSGFDASPHFLKPMIVCTTGPRYELPSPCRPCAAWLGLMSRIIGAGASCLTWKFKTALSDWKEICQLKFQIFIDVQHTSTVTSRVWRRPSWRLPGCRPSRPRRRIAPSTWRHPDGQWFSQGNAGKKWDVSGVFVWFWRIIWQTYCCWGIQPINMTMTYGQDLKVGWISMNIWWKFAALNSLTLAISCPNCWTNLK